MHNKYQVTFYSHYCYCKGKCKDKGNFNFIEVDHKQIEKEILKLDVNKASQSSDISKHHKAVIFLVIFSATALTIP